jgi:2-oxoglutarate ferredoxin oxidoreductase subunit alpha
MAEKILINGNEALGYGALYADCRCFFGYPITPQNEVIEFFARELPKIGGVFVQTESEVSSINMLYGAAATGVRAMTSSSSTGFSLMQEGISTLAATELPCVIVDVQRGGPGGGNTQTSQMDYLQVTRGGGNGGYHNIVLSPASVQETFELVQLAFYLADKYRHPVIILSDAIIGQMRENLELKKLDFGPLPEKNTWSLTTVAEHGDPGRFIHNAPGILGNYRDYMLRITQKYHEMTKNEIRYQACQTEDADLILVSFGSSARSALWAYHQARKEGLKVGFIRPITLWPFPTEIIRATAEYTKKFVVVEDNLGQMLRDVQLAVQEKAEVHLVGIAHRHLVTSSGMIFPKTVLQEVKKLL